MSGIFSFSKDGALGNKGNNKVKLLPRANILLLRSRWAGGRQETPRDDGRVDGDGGGGGFPGAGYLHTRHAVCIDDVSLSACQSHVSEVLFIKKEMKMKPSSRGQFLEVAWQFTSRCPAQPCF